MNPPHQLLMNVVSKPMLQHKWTSKKRQLREKFINFKMKTSHGKSSTGESTSQIKEMASGKVEAVKNATASLGKGLKKSIKSSSKDAGQFASSLGEFFAVEDVLKSIDKAAHPKKYDDRKSSVIHTPIDWTKYPKSSFQSFFEDCSTILEEDEEEDEEEEEEEDEEEEEEEGEGDEIGLKESQTSTSPLYEVNDRDNRRPIPSIVTTSCYDENVFQDKPREYDNESTMSLKFRNYYQRFISSGSLDSTSTSNSNDSSCFDLLSLPFEQKMLSEHQPSNISPHHRRFSRRSKSANDLDIPTSDEGKSGQNDRFQLDRSNSFNRILTSSSSNHNIRISRQEELERRRLSDSTLSTSLNGMMQKDLALSGNQVDRRRFSDSRLSPSWIDKPSKLTEKLDRRRMSDSRLAAPRAERESEATLSRNQQNDLRRLSDSKQSLSENKSKCTNSIRHNEEVDRRGLYDSKLSPSASERKRSNLLSSTREFVQRRISGSKLSPSGSHKEYTKLSTQNKKADQRRLSDSKLISIWSGKKRTDNVAKHDSQLNDRRCSESRISSSSATLSPYENQFPDHALYKERKKKPVSKKSMLQHPSYVSHMSEVSISTSIYQNTSPYSLMHPLQYGDTDFINTRAENRTTYLIAETNQRSAFYFKSPIPMRRKSSTSSPKAS